VTEVVVCCGVGGTGKTTTAAALGVAAALAGRRAVVLTIDPARRLADALGLASLPNQATEVSVPGAEGTLHALMLDRKGTWDAVIRRFAATPDDATRLLDNRYYRAVSTRLTGSHEYMAIEKLYELVHTDRWDLVIVDTPPARHVLDFFRAPDRVARLLDRSVLGVLTEPGRGLLGGATRAAIGVGERVAGDAVMSDIADFFRLFQGLSSGFRARAAATSRLLRSPRTRYYLVTHASAPERNDILGFLATLRGEGMQFAGFLVNRTAQRVEVDERDLPDAVAGVDAATWSQWRTALRALPSTRRRRREAHLTAARKLVDAAGGSPAWLVPELDQSPRDVKSLAQLARFLPPNPPSTF
jgi:anion-transporting  ArsA/GET3 family ATPase